MTRARLYLYGRGDSRVAALFGNPDFHTVVQGLFAMGQAPAAAGNEALRSAVACGLLTEENGAVSAGPRMVLVPGHSEQAFHSSIQEFLDRYAEIAGQTVIALRNAYEKTVAARRFGWSDVSHALVAGMFLDLAVGSELWRSGWIKRQPWETLVWAFERVSASNAFGVQWVGHHGQRWGFAQLWHHRVERPTLKLSERHVEILRQIASSDLVQNDTDLLYLRYLRLVRQEGSFWKLGIPVFDGADTQRIFPLLIENARWLVDEAIAPALERTSDFFWVQDVGRSDASRHAAVRLMLEYGIDRVVSAGLTDPFPEGSAVPVCWGRWLWHEPVGSPELIAGGFDSPEVGA